jgi:gas vesicle protein
MENEHMAKEEEMYFGVTPGQKLMLLVIGGGIGAAAALLFAPKSGRELRGDIAGAIDKGYDTALVATSNLKNRSTEFYEAAKGTSGEVLDVVSSRLSVIKEELRGDIDEIGAIVESSPICGTRQQIS